MQKRALLHKTEVYVDELNQLHVEYEYIDPVKLIKGLEKGDRVTAHTLAAVIREINASTAHMEDRINELLKFK